jgi:alpha-L-rhamnosidase
LEFEWLRVVLWSFGMGGGRRNIWEERTTLMAQLEIEYADGSKDVVSSDDTWEAAKGPIRRDEIYDGEKYDCQYEIPGWSTATFQKDGINVWTKAAVLQHLTEATDLVAMYGAIRRFEALQLVKKIITPSGMDVIDIG